MSAEYHWQYTDHAEPHLLKPLRQLLQSIAGGHADKILDLGCGNGFLAEQLQSWGYEVIGIDPSSSGIAAAQHRNPHLRFYQAAADPKELNALQLPLFDVVVSTEVVEHCYAPRLWAQSAFQALKPGGVLICSTPYHGYLKNCALALTGELDHHFTALWDGGHIKFWSRRTLSSLLRDSGFELIAFRGAGRCPWLWKSMLIAARKPLSR